MISVIVPVYNVEPYLRKCLDSIIEQTYRDLEILVIDDGSTDGSGLICDEFAERDSRIQVFHTENRGLSAARNLGLKNARGGYLGFVDSDDWIEPDMYEALIRRAEETGADIVECGVFIDFPGTSIKQVAIQQTTTKDKSLEKLLLGHMSTMVWNKIYHQSLFKKVRFPEGCLFEDIATTPKIVRRAVVSGVANISYHWVQRESSISQGHDKQNLIDYWFAYKERYDEFKDAVSQEANQALLKGCAYAIARTWVWYWKSESDPKFVEELSSFSRSQYHLFGDKTWSIDLRAIIFLSRFNKRSSFAIAYAINQLFRLFKPEYYK